MGSLPGGSAWALAKDIAEGHVMVTERLAKRLGGDLERVQFEVDRRLRTIRGTQPALDDIEALRTRNRKIQRLSSCLMILRAYRMRVKRRVR